MNGVQNEATPQSGTQGEATGAPAGASMKKLRRSQLEAAQREREWLARRQNAEDRADQLIRAARMAQPTRRAALVEVTSRVAAALDLARCDLLMLGTGDRAILFQMCATETRIRAVRIGATESPVALLRGAGSSSRFHAFINRVGSLRPLGVLSVEIADARRLTLDERAFVNAVGDRLSTAIAEGELPGRT